MDALSIFFAIRHSKCLVRTVLFPCIRNIHSDHRMKMRVKHIDLLRPGQLAHCSRPFVNGIKMEKPEKKLFTPGPLGVSKSTKEAMLRDLGSRDKDFMETVKFVRHRLLDLAGVSPNQFTSVLLQGSGTYGVEAVLRTVIKPNHGKLLIVINGAYGKRMVTICQRANLSFDMLEFTETDQVSTGALETYLQKKSGYNAVAVVHCETTTGIVNDIEAVGQVVKKYCPGSVFIVDAMSSFGAIPIDFEKACIDYLVTSANKCLEGVPGFSILIANTKELLSCKGNCSSLSLDVVDQYEVMEKTGQFRFTPPTHTILALAQALQELDLEGGVQGRAQRYRSNCEILKEGMKKFGFHQMIPDKINGCIITTYHLPRDPKFIFEKFYHQLNKLDQVIYPGKVTNVDSFRIGSIGHLFPDDVIQLLRCIETVCLEMGVSLPFE